VRHFVAAKILCLHWFDAEWLTAQASSFKQQATSNKQQATSNKRAKRAREKPQAATFCRSDNLQCDNVDK